VKAPLTGSATFRGSRVIFHGCRNAAEREARLREWLQGIADHELRLLETAMLVDVDDADPDDIASAMQEYTDTWAAKIEEIVVWLREFVEREFPGHEAAVGDR
jgi:hypothetical protein